MDFSVPEGKMDLSPPEDTARRGMLEEAAMFPAFGNDASVSPGAESPEQMQKNDPLGTQIWKLYSRAKTQLPNAERMENLTWRMMAMNMRRAELDRNKGYECRHVPRADRSLRSVRLFVHMLTRRCSSAEMLSMLRATN
jgi:GATA-binding protein